MGKNAPNNKKKADHLHAILKTKGRPKKVTHGRPAGAKNKTRERYTEDALQEAVNMDIDRMRDPKNHLYPSRREMCKALKIPESTVRLQLRKLKLKVPIRTKALGMTGQALNRYRGKHSGQCNS